MLTVKILVLIIVVLAAVVAVRLLIRAGTKPQEPSARPASPNVFADLRNKALRLTRAELGLPAGRVPTEPFGVLMEMGYENGSATVVALGEGSASIYLSTGGGSIGGGGHDPVRKAALAMVATAVLPPLRPSNLSALRTARRPGRQAPARSGG